MPFSEMSAAIAEVDRKATEAKEMATAAKAEIGAHERECVVRYEGIHKSLGEIKAGLVQDRVAIAEERARFAKFVWSLMGAIALLVVSLIAWLAVQLYTLEPLRVQAEAHRASPAPAIAPK